MTQEGLIHKVYQPILEYFWLKWQEDKNEDPESEYTKHSEQDFRIVNNSFNELIKEIEKHAFFTACDISLNVVELDKLIGETKE